MIGEGVHGTGRRAAFLAALGVGCLLAGCGGGARTATTTTPGTTTAGTTPYDASAPGTYLPRDKFNTTSQVPTSIGPASSTATVSVIRPTSSNQSALGVAFGQYEMFAHCTSETVPGTVHLAKIRSSGVSWAVAGFKPAPTCSDKNIGPFTEIPLPPVGVFEQQRGGRWTMNSEAGKPFPCPGRSPGAGNPSVPEEVLSAWKVPYFSPNCRPVYPVPPR